MPIPFVPLAVNPVKEAFIRKPRVPSVPMRIWHSSVAVPLSVSKQNPIPARAEGVISAGAPVMVKAVVLLVPVTLASVVSVTTSPMIE